MIVSIKTTLALRAVTFEPHSGSEGKANLCLPFVSSQPLVGRSAQGIVCAQHLVES